MNYIDLGEATRIYKKESVFNGCNQTSLAFPKFKRIPIKNYLRYVNFSKFKKFK
jgi:hypothetical protein